MFNEYLDKNMMAKSVGKSANRALGLLIAKCIYIHESVWMWIYKYIVFIYDIMYGLLWFNMNPWS